MTASTLLFLALPSGVLLVATGLSGPYPLAITLSFAIPYLSVRTFATASALF